MEGEKTMTDGKPVGDKKKQAPSPWEKKKFLQAFITHSKGAKTWKDFYEAMKSSAIHDTNGAFTPGENNIRLRCLNANKALKKAGMKEVPHPKYVPAKKEQSIEEMMKELGWK